MNAETLDWLKAQGASYEKSNEGLTVSWLKTAPSSEDAARLAQLQNVQQLAINAASVDQAALLQLAKMPGLQLLLITGRDLESEEFLELEAAGPEVASLDDD